MRYPTTPKEFWAACVKADNGCWTYDRLIKPPQLYYRDRLISAHRLAWELYHRKRISSKFLLVLRSCKNPSCVNPAHLYLGTSKDVDSRNSTPEDFWNRVNKNGPIVYKKLGRCWVWTGGIYQNDGYGQIQYRKKSYGAHRLSWLFEHGTLPDPPLIICHRFDNPLCVRPSHLFAATPKENTADMIAKGRWRGTPKGFVMPLATRIKLSVAMRGKQTRLGAVLSAETKAKIGNANRRIWAAKRAAAGK